MSRWIDADALQRALAQMWYDSQISITGISVSELIHKQPSIDIVRCKECKYFESKEDWCYWRDEMITADDFCSYGVRDSGKPNNCEQTERSE